MRSLLLLCVLATAVAPLDTSAQTVRVAGPGQRIRVVELDDGLGSVRAGKLLEATASALTVRVDGEAAPLVIDRSRIFSLEVSTAPDRRDYLVPAGLLAGAGLGYLLGQSAGDDCGQTPFFCVERSTASLVLAMTFGVTFAHLGWWLGAERWASAEAPSVAISAAPEPGGGSIGLRISF